MSKKTPSPPPAPDPLVVNAAQTASNKDTALYNAALNRVDQYSPQGSITYKQNAGQFDQTSYDAALAEYMKGQEIADPTARSNYYGEVGKRGGQTTMPTKEAFTLPSWSMNTQLSPEAQKQYDSEQRVGIATTQLGEDQLGRLREALSKSFSFDGLPKAPGVDDFSADRDKVTQSIIDRNSPQMTAARNMLENKLVNQGIQRGSKAWQQAVDDLNRQQNDFNLGALQAGGAEQSRLYGLGTDARSRAIQEYTTQRNQPLNELSALLSQSQISNPQFQNAPGANAAPTDTTAAYNTQYQGQLANFNAQNSANQSAMGNLFGLGGSLAGGLASKYGLSFLSDYRLKENVRHTGYEKGFPIYEFSYKSDPEHITYRGVMAQDVLKLRPDAIVDDGNYMAVDYGKIGIEFARVQ